MAKPSLSLALSWDDYEQAVQGVFIEALRLLAKVKHLPAAEVPLNLEVYWLARRVHDAQRRAGKCRYPFTIEHDSTNQPQPDDSALAPRLRKRPDFAYNMKDEQEPDFRKSQVCYQLECKRLGTPEGQLVFNDLYSEKGVARFRDVEHQYGKNCDSATMIGYVQDMPHEDALKEVNAFAKKRTVPSLVKAAAGWVARGVTTLPLQTLPRAAFDPHPIQLTHFWVDLRHCKFDVPSGRPPQSAASPPARKPKAKNAGAR